MPAGSAEVLQHVGTADIRFSATAAEAVVRRGLKATVLQELAGATGMDMHHLLEFAGVDRSTVSRRVARDDLLPQEASVRAMQLTDLVATAVDVFGSVEAATGWLTKPHPVLETRPRCSERGHRGACSESAPSSAPSSTAVPFDGHGLQNRLLAGSHPPRASTWIHAGRRTLAHAQGWTTPQAADLRPVKPGAGAARKARPGERICATQPSALRVVVAECDRHGGAASIQLEA